MRGVPVTTVASSSFTWTLTTSLFMYVPAADMAVADTTSGETASIAREAIAFMLGTEGSPAEPPNSVI